MSARRGFTLVELLVVIAIIALLISILAPSLNAAKDLAKNTMCMTNLHSMCLNINVYAESNRGIIPPYTINRPISPKPYYTQCAFQGSAVDPNDGLLSDRRSFAVVYTLGAVTQPELFYCPGQPSTFPMGQFKTYPKPWGSAISTQAIGTQFVRAGYLYNPNVDDQATRFTAGPRIDTFSREYPLTLDILTREDGFAHTMGGYKWNVGYADGRAEGRSDASITKLIKDNQFSVNNEAEELWSYFNVIYDALMDR
jgi:prepilin-type N-terminal cleavage/methylation domain-containing protein